MKRILICMPALAAVVFFSECKKGADDPAISFRTRKARVVGSWHIKTGTATATITRQGAPYNFLYKFDAAKCEQYVTDYTGRPSIANFAYSINVNFKADGTFAMVEVIAGKTLDASGTWNFTGKIGEDKNKESIVMKLTSIARGVIISDTEDHWFNQLNSEFTYKIKELRNKKMVLTAAKTEFVYGGAWDYASEYTLIQ